MQSINVLNHGLVRLVEHMGSDLSIVQECEGFSYDAEWRSGADDGKDAKLIDYLVKQPPHLAPWSVSSSRST
jgi:thymidylate synthase (FAD)